MHVFPRGGHHGPGCVRSPLKQPTPPGFLFLATLRQPGVYRLTQGRHPVFLYRRKSPDVCRIGAAGAQALPRGTDCQRLRLPAQLVSLVEQQRLRRLRGLSWSGWQ